MSLIDNVRIKKEDLLSALKSNLEKHKSDVAEALELRRTQIKKRFDDEIFKLLDDPKYQSEQHINFPLPQDNSSEYERAIRMVEMTQDEIIELDEGQFDKLVMDNWYWKNDLITTSALYGKAIH